MNTDTIDLAVLKQALTLPCGLVLPNRLAKAAMTEGLAGGDNRANARFVTLYRRWGEGGAGLLVTGNVHIDRWHLERGGNIAIEGPQDDDALGKLAELAQAAKAHGSRILMQLNHCGRQTQKMINPHPNAPSDVGLKMGNGRFGRPRPMSPPQIEAALQALVAAACVAARTGFDGVQLHGAHGYLISQFLSPLSNRRGDAWGGSLEHRARFLLEAVRRIRAAVGPRQAISVKLNSADFQRGGFSEDDAVTVAKWLEDAGVDLLEVSGGNYEQPRMIDFDRKDPLGRGARRESTRRREAYFLDFVPGLRRAVRLPVMVTGGFRSAAAMVDAVAHDGVDVIGLGRPLVLDPDGARKLLNGEVDRLFSRDEDLVVGRGLFGPASPVSFLRDLNAWGAFGWYSEHIYALADGRSPDLGLSALRALLAYDRTEAATAKALRRGPQPAPACDPQPAPARGPGT